MLPILLKLHRWAGLTAGVFVFILASSGALLVVGADVDRLLNRRLLTVTPGPGRAPLESVLGNVRGAYPPEVVTRIALPQRPDDSIQPLSQRGLVRGLAPHSPQALA